MGGGWEAVFVRYHADNELHDVGEACAVFLRVIPYSVCTLCIYRLLKEDDNQGCFFKFVNTVQSINEKALPLCHLPEVEGSVLCPPFS